MPRRRGEGGERLYTAEAEFGEEGGGGYSFHAMALVV